MTRYWTDEEMDELRNAWLSRHPEAKMEAWCIQYAENNKRTFHSVLHKLRGLNLLAVRSSQYKVWNDVPVLQGDAFILMDAHIPYHHGEFISKCLDVCKRWGIKQMIFGGDALDFNAFAQFPENFEEDGKSLIDGNTFEILLAFSQTLPMKQQQAMMNILSNSEREGGNISEEIRESRKVLKSFEDSFDLLLWIMGNHEQRLTRILEKVLGVEDMARLIGADNAKWKVSPYYWCKLESGGINWQIEHPVNTGKGSSKRLAPKYDCNIVMGHNHHFNITTDPSGRYLAIEPGMGADETKAGYVNQRHNAADLHVLGALIIRDGKPTVLNKFTDWDMLK